MKNLKRIMAITALVGTTMISTESIALDANIDATVAFLPAITLTQNQIIDFGTVEFSGAANDTVTVATSDAVTYGGATMSGSGTGTAGEMAITGGTGATVDVSCDDTGAQVGDGLNTLNLQAAEIIMGTGNGVAATLATDCAGLGTTPIAHVMTGTAADNTVLVGAEINTASGTVAAGTYTSTLSGNFIQIRAVYQ